ncbi:MAG: tRNA threonylcarbamoyladenosine dehydratase [Clostridia bacterium]|nr:tRNA threonylcarbamoyladenosine dehydratase [Clostridia bacterium]
MLSQFSRSELIFGKSSTEILKNSRVAVFGIGGVGSYIAEALARAGVGAIDIIDADRVNLTNINRQLIALHSTEGMLKTDVCEARIRDINPQCNVVKHDMFYLPECDFDFSVYDYVADAIDTVTGKIDIAVKCAAAGVRLISSMGTGNKTDPTAFKVADIYDTKVCPLARVMRSELKKRKVTSLKVVYSEETPHPQDREALEEYLAQSGDTVKNSIPGSNPFVPPVAGLIIASEIIKDLINKDDAI